MSQNRLAGVVSWGTFLIAAYVMARFVSSKLIFDDNVKSISIFFFHFELNSIDFLGIGCGRRNFPGIYTNVYRYINWIERTINASPAITQSSLLMLVTAFAAIFARSIF